MKVSAAGDGRTPATPLGRRLAAEMLGTGFLLIAVVGSGIAGERLAAGNTALVVLAGASATGAALFALIEWLAPLSGAHFNPLVTLALLFRGDITGRVAAAYVPIQLLGAVIGVGVADAMFEVPVFSLSAQARSGPSQMLGEFVSTFGLVGAVWMCSRTRPSSLAGVVAAYVFGTFWFTPTGFANPAVTVARAFTDTFSGIRPTDVPAFIAGQCAGMVAAVAVFRWLLPNPRPGAGEVDPAAATDRERRPHEHQHDRAVGGARVR
jgi:glycerol uptake facilitator-like aquaporin